MEPADTPSTRLIVRPDEGLLNRLRALASASILADDTRRELWLDWRRNRACGASWSELFASPMLPECTSPEGVSEHYAVEVDARLAELLNDPTTPEVRLTSCFAFRVPSMSRDAHARRRGEFYRRLRPVDKAQQRIDEFLRTHPEHARAVGVHIRLKDWVSFSGGAKHHISPPEVFIARASALANRDPRARFFVCSDDQGAVAALESALPGRVYTVPKAEVDRTSTTSMQDAVIDWMLLSQCRCILAPPYSSFSKEASLVRGIPWTPVAIRSRQVRLWLFQKIVHPIRMARMRRSQPG